MPEDKTTAEKKLSLDIATLEETRIKEAISRSDTEKFFLFTRMMKIHFMLKNAKIIKK